jgi:hypothetical protein
VVSVGIAGNEQYKYIMSAYQKPSIKLWSLKGELLTTIDTGMGSHTYAAVSPWYVLRFLSSHVLTSGSGKFVAVAGVYCYVCN